MNNLMYVMARSIGPLDLGVHSIVPLDLVFPMAMDSDSASRLSDSHFSSNQ